MEINAFMARALQHEILSEEEIRALLSKYKQGNVSAGNRVLEHNLRFVYSVVNKHVRVTDDHFWDVFHEALMGMQNAIELFDMSVTSRFFTYAVWHVRAYINRYFVERHALIRITDNQVANYVKECSSADEWTDSATKKDDGTTKYTAKGLRFNAKSSSIRKKMLSRFVVDVHEPGEHTSNLIEVVPNPYSDHMDYEVQHDQKKLLDLVTSGLDASQLDLLYAMHGIGSDEEEHNMADLRPRYNNVSRERLRQRKLQAYKKVRTTAENKKITRQSLLEVLT